MALACRVTTYAARVTRAEQREQTRERIIAAAVEAFADHGYEGAGTRDIAARAGVTQGLIAYHFESKEALWRAATGLIFGELADHLPPMADPTPESAREALRAFVRFSASQPAVLHFMLDAGRGPGDRLRWLVSTHLADRYGPFVTMLGPELAPHLYYIAIGAASLVFQLAPECAQLTGRDPMEDTFIERHADLVADLLLPE